MRPIINFSVIALAAVSIILSACSGARAQDQTFVGESATLGEGEIHTWTQFVLR